MGLRRSAPRLGRARPARERERRGVPIASQNPSAGSGQPPRSSGDPARKRAVLYRRVPPLALHLYAGRDRRGSIKEHLKRYGLDCTDVDILRDGPDMDLLSDAAWERWLAKIDDRKYGHVHLGTPCTT